MLSRNITFQVASGLCRIPHSHRKSILRERGRRQILRGKVKRAALEFSFFLKGVFFGIVDWSNCIEVLCWWLGSPWIIYSKPIVQNEYNIPVFNKHVQSVKQRPAAGIDRENTPTIIFYLLCTTAIQILPAKRTRSVKKPPRDQKWRLNRRWTIRGRKALGTQYNRYSIDI
jgi:hypothetical protein